VEIFFWIFLSPKVKTGAEIKLKDSYIVDAMLKVKEFSHHTYIISNIMDAEDT
jgi:hypothetical protein